MNDPLMAYFWPDAARRVRALPLFWHARVEARRRAGIVDTVSDGDGLAAVVLWEQPGISPPMAKPFSLIRSLGVAAPRALAASGRIEKLRPATPHLYVAVAATAARARGKRLVSELLRARIAAADSDVFAVATNPASVAVAEHMGFRATGDLPIGAAVLRGMLLSK